MTDGAAGPPSGHRRGWWRRNVWGLLALLPVLLAITAADPYGAWSVWRETRPGSAVIAGADGWVSYAGARARLVSVEPADLRRRDEEPFPLPSGLAAWQATVSFERTAQPDGSLRGCEFRLEDDSGRLFGDDPSEVVDAYVAGESYFGGVICAPPAEDPDAARYDVVALFVLPGPARPVALRLTALDAKPDYARFPLP